jgi:competence protein ComFC
MVVPGAIRKPAYHLYRLAWTGLDWLFPPQCGGCGKPYTRWCLECQKNTETLPRTVCKKCGEALATGDFCSRCRSAPPDYQALRSWGWFKGPLRNGLLRLKYHGDMALGEIFARSLIELLVELDWPVDFITPVPLGIARQAERGYNQASMLALPLALGCGMKFLPQALVKVRETRSQVGLSGDQRHANVAEAFQAREKLVRSKNVLVVDDVTTSGATIESCAAALFNAGARDVYALTLARAYRD